MTLSWVVVLRVKVVVRNDITREMTLDGGLEMRIGDLDGAPVDIFSKAVLKTHHDSEVALCVDERVSESRRRVRM